MHLNIMLSLFTCELLLLVAASLSEGRNDSLCEGKEKPGAILDIVSDSISRAKDLYPTCMDNSSSNCWKKEKSLTYLGIAQNLIAEAKKSIPICDVPQELKEKPTDCSKVLRNGHKLSGVYTIWPRNGVTSNKSVEVYCDMDTDGGGWTVIQRRGNFSKQQDFYQDWENYKIGFGNITRDFWLGNDNIYAITNQGDYSVRFDLEDVDRSRRFAQYRVFWIENEKTKYMLHISNYTGDAGDGMSEENGIVFSTKDKEIDTHMCAQSYKGGWWYNGCTYCNLNGLYQPGTKNDKKAIYWSKWHKVECLAASEMKLRVN